MKQFLTRLAAEPAAVGALISTTLPALIALGVLSLDTQTIGVLVVAVNAIVAFVVRMFVAPSGLKNKDEPAPAPAG